MRKPCETLEQENGTMYLYGNHHWKEIEYKIPEWNEDDENPDYEACFTYLGYTYFLSEFMRVDKQDKHNPFNDLRLDIHGYLSDSFFSGVLVHYSDCGDAIKVYTYIS